MIYPAGRARGHKLHRKFLRLLPFLPENFQHTHKIWWIRWDYPLKSFSERVDQSHLTMESFTGVGSKSICTAFPRQYTQLSYKRFTGATAPVRSMGGRSFGNILPVEVPHCQRGKVHVFWYTNFQSCQNFTIWNPVFNLALQILLKPWTL